MTSWKRSRPSAARRWTVFGHVPRALRADSERMAFGMPAYGDPKTPFFAFNSQKQYIALYAGKAALDAFPERMAGVDRGGGCARWKKPEKMDFELIADILDHIRASGRGGC
jgi:uncharacterized protein YdhG (YjbR/CyaY superfamily)